MVAQKKSSVPILEVHDEVLALKQDTHRSNHKGVSDKFNDIYEQLASSLRKCVDIILEKKVFLPGSQLSLFRNMDMPYTNGHLLMQFSFIMGGG